MGACSGGHTGRPYGCTADSVRRAGCPHPAEPGRRDCRASKYRSSRRSSRRGGLHARPCRTAGSNRPSVIAARSWRHVGMPPYEVPRGVRWETQSCPGGYKIRPYGVRRGCGGNRGLVRAAIQAAPTDAPPIRFVGRGAHTPPNQAAGIAGLASIAAAAGPLVGAGFMPARAAPPGATGPRSSRPGHGGMWACRPTAFGEVRQKPEGVLGRI